MIDYSKMTDDEFYEILKEYVNDMTTDDLLSIGDVYTALADEFNNDILDTWARRNPKKSGWRGEE